VPETLFSDCQSLFRQSTSVTVVLDSTELYTLYYLAGYVISRVQKHNVLCSDCILCLRSADYLTEIDAAVTKLLVLKEFKSGSLVASSQLVFDLFIVAETRFRQIEPCLLSVKCNVKQHVVDDILQRTKDLNFPE